jgi:CheY-like chemotaxis protein
VGLGSEFTVRLPVASGSPAADSASATSHERVPGKPRVLVVDDNHDAADSLGDLLRKLGADVRVTHDGWAALAEVSRFRPAVVFLDLGMPGMDGYAAAHEIRARDNGSRPLLVALTGRGQDSDKARTRQAGFDRHVVKPADIGTLRSVLSVV